MIHRLLPRITLAFPNNLLYWPHSANCALKLVKKIVNPMMVDRADIYPQTLEIPYEDQRTVEMHNRISWLLDL